jgi:hypothetical protein
MTGSKASVRAGLRLLRRNALYAARNVRLLLRRPGWLHWNRYVGKVVSGYDANRHLRLGFPCNVLSAARKMGVKVEFHNCGNWAAVLESDRHGRATIHMDDNIMVDEQRYLIALALGYLLHTPPATLVRLRLDMHGRARREDTLDEARRPALIFALRLLLPYHRGRLGAGWLARQAQVPVWFAQQGIDGPWTLIQDEPFVET